MRTIDTYAAAIWLGSIAYSWFLAASNIARLPAEFVFLLAIPVLLIGVFAQVLVSYRLPERWLITLLVLIMAGPVSAYLMQFMVSVVHQGRMHFGIGLYGGGVMFVCMLIYISCILLSFLLIGILSNTWKFLRQRILGQDHH